MKHTTLTRAIVLKKDHSYRNRQGNIVTIVDVNTNTSAFPFKDSNNRQYRADGRYLTKHRGFDLIEECE